MGKYFYKYPRYSKKTKKPKTKAKAKPTKMKQMVKTIVKKEMSRATENKEVANTDNYWEIYQTGSISITTSTVAILSPTIAQGVGENGRIGNSVKLKNLYLRGYMSVYPQTNLGVISNSSVPQIPGQFNVRLFIGKLKQSILPPQTSDFAQLLRTGAATTSFDSTNMLSLCRTVNSELFTVYYDKIHKIGLATHSGGQANFSTTFGLANNDYKLSKILKINCTKFIKKTLIFNDNNNQPTNTGLYMWAGIVDSLGSANTTVAPLVNFTYDLEFSYEDA